MEEILPNQFEKSTLLFVLKYPLLERFLRTISKKKTLLLSTKLNSGHNG